MNNPKAKRETLDVKLQLDEILETTEFGIQAVILPRYGTANNYHFLHCPK